MKKLDPFFLFYLILVLLLNLVFSLSQDLLFYKTDLVTLAWFLLALGFGVFLICLPLFLPIALLLNKRSSDRVPRILSVLAFSLILFGLLIHVADKFFLDTHSVQVFLMVAGLLLLVSVGMAFIASRSGGLIDRITVLARVFGILSLAFLGFQYFSLLTGWGHAEPPPQRKNVVMIVLDGLSTKFLSTYNPKETTPDFSEIAKQSVVYKNTRSNFAYTAGYFYSLYSGKKDWARYSPDSQVGLFSVLQEAGVQPRWFTFHSNGIPDSHNFPHDFPYRGLRSVFLVGKLAWIPRMLGIDYNVFELSGPHSRGKPLGYRESALSKWLLEFNGDSFLAPLEHHVVDEIESLREDPRPFFLLVHLPPGALVKRDTDPELWVMEKKDFVPDTRLRKARQKVIRDQGFTYKKEDEWAVSLFANHYRNEVRSGTKSLKKFFDIFKEKGWGRDTMLVVTADHGKMFSKGKVEYMYHNDEEVARVPLLVHWKGKKGENYQMRETIDITQTLLEFFEIPHRFSDDAVSLFSEQRKPMVTTLTDWAPSRGEYFLNVYWEDSKYVANISPGAFSIHRETLEGYFNTRRVPSENMEVDSLGFDLKKIVRDYGFPGDPQKARTILDLIR